MKLVVKSSVVPNDPCGYGIDDDDDDVAFLGRLKLCINLWPAQKCPNLQLVYQFRVA